MLRDFCITSSCTVYCKLYCVLCIERGLKRMLPIQICFHCNSQHLHRVELAVYNQYPSLFPTLPIPDLLKICNLWLSYIGWALRARPESLWALINFADSLIFIKIDLSDISVHPRIHTQIQSLRLASSGAQTQIPSTTKPNACQSGTPARHQQIPS